MLNGKIASDFELVRDSTIIKREVIPAHRGSIYSRNGEVLATSITRRTMRIDFGSDRFKKMGLENYEKEAKELAHNLSDYFGDRTAKEYYNCLIKYNKQTITYRTNTTIVKPKWWQFWKEEEKVVKNTATAKNVNRSVRLFRDVDINEWQEIKDFPLLHGGLGVTYSVEDRDYRVYPQGDLAMRTIGRLEHHRSYGIERAFRDTLAGHTGYEKRQIVAPGYKTTVRDKDNIPAQDGYDVITTLDVDVQDVAHQALAEQLIEQNAIWGTTIVMECATGDVLAMVNLKRDGTTCVEEQNYAIGIPINPGSTFKLVSTMALLEKGVPTSKEYNSELGKRVRVGGDKGAWVQDSHAISRETNGVIDMRRAFAESANVYFTRAVFDAFHTKPSEFSDWCRKLRVDTLVGLERMGAKYYLWFRDLDKKHPSRLNALVNMAYGYGLDITPLHTIAIYNAVANNGRMVAPRLVLRTECNGKVISEAPVRVIEEEICSKPTIDTLRSFMEEVSLTGTAKEFFGTNRCSFRTGSKTGTAQVNTKINNVKYKKEDKHYFGSMVTYLPADNPRYTIMTAIFTKQQSGKFYYGASLTGPVQKQVATFLYNRDRQYAEEVANGDYRTSEIKGGNMERMRKVANEYGDKYSAESRHGWGKGSVDNDGKLQISTLNTKSGCVPNVVGMGLDDALYLLEKSGLTVDIVGYGKVVKQSIAPNTAVATTNRRITITLK